MASIYTDRYAWNRVDQEWDQSELLMCALLTIRGLLFPPAPSNWVRRRLWRPMGRSFWTKMCLKTNGSTKDASEIGGYYLALEKERASEDIYWVSYLDEITD